MSDQFYRQLGEMQKALTAVVTKEVESLKAERQRLQAKCVAMGEDYADLAMMAQASHVQDCDCSVCKLANKYDDERNPGQALLDRMENAEANFKAVMDATCGKCGRALPPDGDCYGCEVDRMQAKCAEMADFIEGHAIDRDHSCIECGNVFGQHDEDCKLAAILKSNPGQALLDRLAKAEQETAYHKSAAEAASKIMHQTDEVWKADKYRLTKLERVRDAAEHVVPEDCSEEQWDEFLEALASCPSKEGK